MDESPLSDYPFYTAAIQKKLAENFVLPRHVNLRNVSSRVEVTILSDGRIEKTQITDSTGDAGVDGYALRAFKRVGRFGPFPDTLRKPFIRVGVRFYYDQDK